MTVNLTFYATGTTFENEERILTGWNEGKLTPLGENQCINLRDHVEDKKYSVAFCSDMDPSFQSARLIFEGLISIKLSPNLRNCNYGIYDGNKIELDPFLEEKISEEESRMEPEPLSKQKSQFLNGDKLRINPLNHVEKAYPGGESYKEVYAKVIDNFCEELTKNYDNSKVAVVGPPSAQYSFEVGLNGKSWEQAIKEDWRLPNSKDVWQPGWEYVLE